MATRLDDLAKIAGVSIATISRALNDSPSVREETKRRIWRLARENGYAFRPTMPSSLDSALASISIVIPTPQGRDGWLLDSFFQELLSGICEAARNSRCDLIVSHVAPQTYDDLSRHLDMSRADGVILLGQSFLHERLNRLMAHSGKFIVWGGELPGQKYCSVGSDNVRGGRRATDHLIRLGRKRIAFFGDIEGPEIAQRYEGYKQALQEADLELDPDLVSPAHFEIESAVAAINTMISRGIEFDSIFAASDTIALGAIRGLMQRGMRVPEDVSIIGYDNIQLAKYTRPALTTIQQDLAQAGRLMVSKLLNAKSSKELISERLPTNVIIRETCGA